MDTTTINVNITLDGGEPKVSVESSTVHPAVAAVRPPWTPSPSSDSMQLRAHAQLGRAIRYWLRSGDASASELKRRTARSLRPFIPEVLAEMESDGRIELVNGKYLLAE